MARKRRRDDILDRMIAKFSLRGMLLHPATLFLVSTVVVLAVALMSWDRYKNQILPPDQFQLTAANVVISPQPLWSDQDLKQVVLGDVDSENYRPKSVMDTDLVGDAAAKLKSIGWIEHIDRIEKSKSGLRVDLTYRQPVGMVEINKTTMPKSVLKNLKPVNLHVDRQGVLMGGRMSESPNDNLLITIGNPMYMDQLLTWSPWLDSRVQGAAKIADTLKDHWKPLGFYRLTTFRSRGNATDRRIPYELWTDPVRKYRVHLIWGNPPGEELTNEASASEKLFALETYAQANGPFNLMTDRVVDVRSGTVVVLGDYKSAKNDDLGEENLSSLK